MRLQKDLTKAHSIKSTFYFDETQKIIRIFTAIIIYKFFHNKNARIGRDICFKTKLVIAREKLRFKPIKHYIFQ